VYLKRQVLVRSPPGAGDPLQRLETVGHRVVPVGQVTHVIAEFFGVDQFH
jgi:hypothetical protein